jgi:hypothetical protein
VESSPLSSAVQVQELNIQLGAHEREVIEPALRASSRPGFRSERSRKASGFGGFTLDFRIKKLKHV